MKKSINLTLPPEKGLDPVALKNTVREILALSPAEPLQVITRRRSIDARKSPVKVHLEIDAYLDQPPDDMITYRPAYEPVDDSHPVIIVGCGPAGLFAALRCIELGYRPLILERGKDVRSRRRDLAMINKQHLVNPESNYCFGEGGAGTYSDGKLYTRSRKRGSVENVLQVLAAHGAPVDILVDSHPHIGTNKLPKVVQALRETIITAGGQIFFDRKVSGFTVKDHMLNGVQDSGGVTYDARAVILATGHSARDIYGLLHHLGLQLEAKPFAVGLRVEHPQALIDRIQYRMTDRGLLPAASYSVSCQLDGSNSRTAFSFCMCPGGFVVPAATNPGEVVVNGMSPSRRDSKYANSGIVVSVSDKDFMEAGYSGPLAGMQYQQAIEQRACQMAGGTQAAPAQRLMDFIHNRISADLPPVSYQPGTVSTDLRGVVPDHVSQGIKTACLLFGKKMKGYLTNDAQLIGVETRTSSPVRIPRDPQSLQHPQLRGLFPCGEGAGYAGGIVSAALDGIRCAESACNFMGASNRRKV